MKGLNSGIAALTMTIATLLMWAPPVSAQAKSADPARWAPWLGCWQLVTETVDEPPNLPAARHLTAESPDRAGARVCVTADGSGVTMTTLVGDTPVLTETVVADGVRTPLAEPGCQGWHRAEWSALGARLFAAAEITCATQPTRTVSGLGLMLAGPEWLDVQVITSEGRTSLRVRRYRRAVNQSHAGDRQPATGGAPMPLGVRLSIADVIEAHRHVAPEALQAALVEMNRGFDLDSRRLLELDQAGVPDPIVDLMVALSYPKRFRVEHNVAGGSGSGAYWGAGSFDSLWPYYADPYFYTSYFAPFGYRYWGHYDPYYFQGPGFVTVDPGPRPIEPSGDGRVVDGRGYTRVRRQEPDSTTGRMGSGAGMGTSSGERGSGSSGSSGGVSSSGYSGSGSGGGERTAQPRPPGGR